VAGHRIRDHKPFSLLNVEDILAQSSDVGAIKIALRLGAPKFYDYIRAFGFGQPTGVDMPEKARAFCGDWRTGRGLDRIDLDGQEVESRRFSSLAPSLRLPTEECFTSRMSLRSCGAGIR